MANLARIDLGQDETEKMASEMGAILGYVDVIKNAVSEIGDLHLENAEVRNVARDDKETHESGFYTEEIIKSAPDFLDNQIKVKKIL